MFKFDTEETINKKIKQFNQKNIRVDFDDVEKYLKEVFLKDKRISNKLLEQFVKENNINEIVDYLMSQAIINPSF